MSSTNDINYKSYVNEENLIVNEFEGPSDPSNYSDILKFSNCVNVLVDSITVPRGKENAVDAVRGKNYHIKNCFVNGSIVAKGAIDGFVVDGCIIHSAQKFSIELGQFDNYWTVGRAPTKNVMIKDSSSLDGKKLVIYLWDADKPHITNSNVKIVKIPKIIWFPYFFFRRLYLKYKGVIK